MLMFFSGSNSKTKHKQPRNQPASPYMSGSYMFSKAVFWKVADSLREQLSGSFKIAKSGCITYLAI